MVCILHRTALIKNDYMKKLTKTICVLAICTSLSAVPAISQTGDNTSSGTTTSSSSDNDDDSGKWGLLGLAGLLGLLGLRKKDDDRHRTTTSVNR